MATGYRIQNFAPELLLDGDQVSESYSNGTTRPGKSVCMSLEDLALYLVQAGVPFDANSTLVEVEGDWSFEDDEDAHLGAHLIHPTRIVRAWTLDDDFAEMINQACDSLGY